MNRIKHLKGSLALTVLNLVLFFPITATPLSSDISETAQIGRKGGSIMIEDPKTGMSVGLSVPEGALTENTDLTLVIHGAKQPGVLAKCNINGISLLPESLLFQEKVRLEVYNPPPEMEVTQLMILYRVINSQFIIPLGNIEHHTDEGWIAGTLYSTGRFSLGTPSPAEISAQCKRLAAWNPARPLALSGEDKEIMLHLSAIDESYDFYAAGGPSALYPDASPAAGFNMVPDVADCLRWQKALTQVEAHLTWVEQHKWTGNTEGEKSEQANAEKALQDAIDDYLEKAPPANLCGSYIKAAAKYLDSAKRLGMDTAGNSRIARHFNDLLDKCAFTFSVEVHEWIMHPKEKLKDGATLEEKSNTYTTLKCYTPWNEFMATGTQKIRGEGNRSVSYEMHWVGDEKNEHNTISGNWKVEKIEGAIQQYVDDHSEQTMLANISIYWKKDVTTHVWGKTPMGTYDESGTDDGTLVEHKSYPLENGYTEKIGNANAGLSLRVFILKAPGDGRDDPNDCF